MFASVTNCSCEVFPARQIQEEQYHDHDTHIHLSGHHRGPGCLRRQRSASVAQNPNGVSNQQLMVRLSQSSSSPDESVRQYTEMMKQGMGADVDSYSATPVAGIGDHALWEVYSGVNQLVMFKSDAAGATRTVIFQPDGFGSEQQSLEYAQALARRALDRF
ncbi:hypothetical protein ACFL00_02740 [Pseudomonadota bacterium]